MDQFPSSLSLLLSWTAYTGPRGGRGWKHSETGRVLYGHDRPGEREASPDVADAPAKAPTDRQAAFRAAHAQHRARKAQARDLLRHVKQTADPDLWHTHFAHGLPLDFDRPLRDRVGTLTTEAEGALRRTSATPGEKAAAYQRLADYCAKTAARMHGQVAGQGEPGTSFASTLATLREGGRLAQDIAEAIRGWRADPGTGLSLSLSTSPTMRSPTESAADVLDRLIQDGAADGAAVAGDVVQRIRDYVLANVAAVPEDVLAGVQGILEEAMPRYADPLADSLLAAWLTAVQQVLEQLPARISPPRVPAPLGETPWYFELQAPTVQQLMRDLFDPALPPALPVSGPIVPGGPPRLPPRIANAVPEPPPSTVWPVVEAAVRDLAERQILRKADYEVLSRDAKDQAFTVAHVEGEKSLERIRDAMQDAVGTGHTLREFAGDVEDVLGVGALSPQHVELVYRNGMVKVYAQGAEDVLSDPLVGGHLPFVMNAGISDERQTEICRIVCRSGLDGTAIFLRDDPEWQRVKIPRHHNERCTPIYLSVEDAAAHGVKYAQRWLAEGRQPMPPEYVPRVDVELPAGWVRMSLSWSAYTGPRSGRGWKSDRTGLVRYQEKMPAEHEHGHAAQGSLFGDFDEVALPAYNASMGKEAHHLTPAFESTPDGTPKTVYRGTGASVPEAFKKNSAGIAAFYTDSPEYAKVYGALH